MNKRKMISSRNGLVAVAAALSLARRLLLLSHISPDGDSLGSTFALQLVLQRQGKQAFAYVPDGIPARYQFLPGTNTVLTSLDELPSPPFTVVVLDCGEWSRVGIEGERFCGLPIVNIDHHRTTSGLGQFNYIDAEAAATGMLLLDLFHYWQEEIDADLATCLYTALAGDTGFFKHSNTTAAVHIAAAELLAAGARQTLVVDGLRGRTPGFMRALSLVLDRIEILTAGKIAYSYLLLDDLRQLKVEPGELEGLVDYPRSLIGVEVAVFFMEQEPAVFKTSLRSSLAVDVSDVAQQFGGGGHARAAGCTMHGSIEQCVQRLIEAVRLQGG